MKTNRLFGRNVLLAMACVIASLAFPGGARAQTNTLVRFHITYGGYFFGDIDVELFDQEKPVTVSNFLNYVRSGAYDNTIFHRASPNTGPGIIQGGGLIVPNPYAQQRWECAPNVVTNGPITNEFLVGPLRSNLAGTLAMAKVADDPDSANSQWFFNLTDNPYLDTDNGGFTVFGRAIRGTNLLTYFRTTRPGDGLIGEIPVAYRNLSVYPNNANLFQVQIIELSMGDTTRPKITLTGAPPNNARLTNATLVVSGTASDNVAVKQVWVYPDDCNYLYAIGSNAWSSTTTMQPGTNYYVFESHDAAGNRSPIVRRIYFHVVPRPLGLEITGRGTVAGATNGQLLEVGRNYLLTAKPATGQLFAEWTARTTVGDTISTGTLANARVVLTMQSNVVLTARFVTNFTALKGNYAGLFYPADQAKVANTNIGSITFTLTEQGKLTGKLLTWGKTLPFTITVAPATGKGSVIITRPGRTSLQVNVTLDLTNQTVFGDVRDARNAIPDFVSPLDIFRVSPGTSAHPAPAAGTYTIAIPGSAATPDSIPAGDGVGRVTVSAAGNLTFVGNLGDGTPVTLGSAVSTNGDWPLYLPLYAGGGSLLSPVTFNLSGTNDAFTATRFWYRPPLAPASKVFTNGFLSPGSVIGSRYRPPVGATRVLDFTNGIAGFSFGDLSTGLTNQVLLSANNVVTNLGVDRLTLTLIKANGLFSGAITPPGFLKPIPFKGTVLQSQGYGTGWFLGTNRSGRVHFGP